jgi:hypothetical protein
LAGRSAKLLVGVGLFAKLAASNRVGRLREANS